MYKMSVKCGKCDALTTAGDAAVKCTACRSLFHSTCVRSFTKGKTRSWKCEGCSDEASPVLSREKEPSEERSWFLCALEDLKVKINSNTDEKILGLQNQVSEFKTQLADMSARTTAVELSNQNLIQRCDLLEQQNACLRGELQSAHTRLADIEQYTRCNNLEVVGIPVTAEEDIYTCLEMLSGVIGVNYRREDISIAHRLRLFSKKLAHPPIIVQFTSRTAKDTWLSAVKRKKTIETTEIAAALRPGRVYVNEHLTAHNKALLGRARRLQRTGKLHYAGYSNGKVIIKPSENATIIRVQQMSDIDKFDK